LMQVGRTRSFEPGERWFYDYHTEEFVTGPKLRGPHSRPLINLRPDRRERCLQTGKRCFTNRGGFLVRPRGPTTGARRAAKLNSVIATRCYSGDHVGVRLVVLVIQHSRYPQSGRVL
jgi:hypothetical protein